MLLWQTNRFESKIHLYDSETSDSHRLSTDQKRMLSENALVPSESIYN